MRRPGLGAHALGDHLVVAPQRAVHEQQIGAGRSAPAAQSVMRGAVGEIDQPARPPASISRPSVSPSMAAVSSRLGSALEIERHLAGRQERADRRAQGLAPASSSEISQLVRLQAAPRDELAVDHLEDRVAVEHGEHPRMGIERERRALAQMQQPGHRVDVAVGQHDGGDRRRAQALAWVQAGVRPRSAGAGRARR